MKTKMYYITISCLVISLIFTQFAPVYACSLEITYNHWYQINYDIQYESLPVDVTVSFLETKTQNVYGLDEPTFYPVNTGYVVHSDLIGAPRLRFTNRGDSVIYLNSLSDNAVEASNTELYDIRRNIVLPERNPQSAGGIEETPPPPFLQDFFITQDMKHFTIPITVTYSLNPFYDESKIGSYALLIDYLNITDTLVLGEVITAATDSSTSDRSDEIFIGGYARVKVEEHLLGDGPSEIEIGPFSFMCQSTIAVGDRAYFLLKTPEDTTSIRYNLMYNNYTGPRSIFTANNQSATIIEEVIQALDGTAPQIVDNTTAIPIADEPIHSLFLPYISR